MEKRYIRADGSTIWISLNMALVRDEERNPVHFVAHMQDITARKRTETALADAEERFRNAFDHAPIGMALTDLDGRITRCNMSL